MSPVPIVFGTVFAELKLPTQVGERDPAVSLIGSITLATVLGCTLR